MPSLTAYVTHLVHESAPGQVGDRLELVVDEQLGQHEEEAERVDAVHHALDAPRVPAGGRGGREGQEG